MKLALKIFILFTFFSIALSASDEERMKERIKSMKKVKMLDLLKLDEATSEKLLIKYNAYEDKLDSKIEEFDIIDEDLEDAVKSGNDTKIKELTQKFLIKRDEIYKLNLEKEEEIKKIINEKKYAIFLIFEKRFRKELGKKLLERKRDRF